MSAMVAYRALCNVCMASSMAAIVLVIGMPIVGLFDGATLPVARERAPLRALIGDSPK